MNERLESITLLFDKPGPEVWVMVLSTRETYGKGEWVKPSDTQEDIAIGTLELALQKWAEASTNVATLIHEVRVSGASFGMPQLHDLWAGGNLWYDDKMKFKSILHELGVKNLLLESVPPERVGEFHFDTDLCPTM